MAGMVELERRLVSIINPAPRDRPTAAFLSSSALLAALATLVVAAGVPVAFSSAPPFPLGARPAGLARDAIVAGPRGPRSAPESAAPRDRAVGRSEAAPDGPEAGSGRLPDPALDRSISADRAVRRGSGALAGQDGPGSAARAGDSAPSAAGMSRNPDSGMIRMRPEAFTLSSASTPAGALAARSPLRPASGGPAAFPEPFVDVPRRFSASAPERARPASSERRTRFVLEVVRGVPIEL
jgi:hypothetical protein